MEPLIPLIAGVVIIIGLTIWAFITPVAPTYNPQTEEEWEEDAKDWHGL